MTTLETITELELSNLDEFLQVMTPWFDDDGGELPVDEPAGPDISRLDTLTATLDQECKVVDEQIALNWERVAECNMQDWEDSCNNAEVTAITKRLRKIREPWLPLQPPPPTITTIPPIASAIRPVPVYRRGDEWETFWNQKLNE
jgi:hypothetical protein